jgi:hypothetical protein
LSHSIHQLFISSTCGWLAKLKAHLQPRDEPVTVNGANGEKMTIPADSENIAPIKVRLLKPLPTWIHYRRTV